MVNPKVTFLSMNSTKVLTELSAKGWVCIDLPEDFCSAEESYRRYMSDSLGLYAYGFKSEILGDIASEISPISANKTIYSSNILSTENEGSIDVQERVEFGIEMHLLSSIDISSARSSNAIALSAILR